MALAKAKRCAKAWGVSLGKAVSSTWGEATSKGILKRLSSSRLYAEVEPKIKLLAVVVGREEDALFVFI
jgi:hypothetical protein